MARYKGFTKLEISQKLHEIGKKYGRDTEQQLIDFINNADKPYISISNNICFRDFGSFGSYLQLLDNLGLEYKWTEPGYYAEAFSELFDIDYCEHDIILALK